MKSRSAQEAEDEALARRLQQEEDVLNSQFPSFEKLGQRSDKEAGGPRGPEADELAARFAQFDLGADWQQICKELGAESVSDLLVLRDSDVQAASLKPVQRRKLLNMLQALRTDSGEEKKRSTKCWRPAPVKSSDAEQGMTLEEELAFFLSATGCEEEEAVQYLGNCESVTEALESWWEMHPEGFAPARAESIATTHSQPLPTSSSGTQSQATPQTAAGKNVNSVFKQKAPTSGGYATGSQPAPAPAPKPTPAAKVNDGSDWWYSRARGEWVDPKVKETDRERHLRKIEENRKNPPVRLRPKKSTGFPGTSVATRSALANMRNPGRYF